MFICGSLIIIIFGAIHFHYDNNYAVHVKVPALETDELSTIVISTANVIHNLYFLFKSSFFVFTPKNTFFV